MKLSGLKNIIILILLLTNLFLLLLVLPREIQRQKAESEAWSGLVSLLSGAGLELQADIPENAPLTMLETSFDLETAETAAAVLITAPILSGENPFSRSFTGGGGSAVFNSNGDFSFELDGSAKPAGDEKSDAAAILKEMGFEASEISAEASGDTVTVTACQELGGFPAFDCTVSLLYENGVLTSVSGRWLNGTATALDESSSSVTASTALIKFLGSQSSLGWISTSITALEEGYVEAETPSASVVRLTPVWRITTDTGVYDVNSIDCTVTVVN